MTDLVTFRIYDLNSDKVISKEEIFLLLKTSLTKHSEEDDDGLKDLVDLAIKKTDEDKDGRISESDWISCIGKENLLLEAFGICLPTREGIKNYLRYDEYDVKGWEETFKERGGLKESKAVM